MKFMVSIGEQSVADPIANRSDRVIGNWPPGTMENLELELKLAAPRSLALDPDNLIRPRTDLHRNGAEWTPHRLHICSGAFNYAHICYYLCKNV